MYCQEKLKKNLLPTTEKIYNILWENLENLAKYIMKLLARKFWDKNFHTKTKFFIKKMY